MIDKSKPEDNATAVNSETYYQRHRQECSDKAKAYREANKEKIKQARLKYDREVEHKHGLTNVEYGKLMRERLIREKAAAYEKDRSMLDTQQKRSRLLKQLISIKGPAGTIATLRSDIEEVYRTRYEDTRRIELEREQEQYIEELRTTININVRKQTPHYTNEVNLRRKQAEQDGDRYRALSLAYALHTINAHCSD